MVNFGKFTIFTCVADYKLIIAMLFREQAPPLSPATRRSIICTTRNTFSSEITFPTLASLPSADHTHHLVSSVFVCIWHFIEFIIFTCCRCSMHYPVASCTTTQHAPSTVHIAQSAPYPRYRWLLIGCSKADLSTRMSDNTVRHWIQNTNGFRDRTWKL